MADCPPLPRRRISPLLLAAIFFLLLAIGARAILSGTDALTQPPWQRIAFAVTGILAAVAALMFGVVACFVQSRTWPLSVFVGLASLWFAGVLANELPQPFARAFSQIRQSSAAGVAQAQRPIPEEKNAPRSAQTAAPLIAWGEAAMLRPYLEHGHHDDAWEEDARQLIRGTALKLAGGWANPGVENLRALGVRILHAGCDDPWVLFLIRRLGDQDPDFPEAMAKFPAAIASHGYPAFPVWLAQAEALRAARRDTPRAATVLAPGCLEALREALSSRPLEAGDYSAWCEVFEGEPSHSLLKQDGEAVCRIVESVPGTQEWFRLWIRGRWEIEQAWLERGFGYANTVSAGQWQRFSEHLAAARADLEQSWKLNPKQPEIARALTTVALGSAGLEEMRLRFDGAARARFDYIPAYDVFRNGLRPRWFGSEEAQLAFGRNCLATQRFDTKVPWQMVRAVRDIAADQNDADEYYKNTAPWDDLKATLDGYLAHGDPARRSYLLSTKAVLAGKRCLPDVLAPLLKELAYKIDPQVVEDWNLPVQWAARMATLCGPASSLLAAAENQQEAQQPEQALQSLLAAQKVPGQLPIVNDYLGGYVAELTAVVAMKSRPWQPLTPPKDLSGWQAEGGEWRVVSPTVLEVKPGSSSARLTRLQPIGDTWELRGNFELVTPGEGRAEAELFCGPSGEQERHGLSLRFWTNGRDWSGISVARGLGEDAFSKKANFVRSTPFTVRMINHRVRVFANKTLWIADQPMPAGVTIENGALLALGATGYGACTVQFRNLEWRAPGNEHQQ